MTWDPNTALSAWPAIVEGMRVTLMIVLFGTIIAFSLGLVFATTLRGRAGFVAAAIRASVSFVRNTPLLVQVYFLHYFALPSIGLRVSALVTGIVAIGLHYSAYTAEVYRAGIDGVPRTQWDAATALQLTRYQTLRHVILPQAVPPMLPQLGNYVIAMFKDAPLLSAISVAEVLTRALDHGARHFRYLEALTIVGGLYLVVSLIASALLERLQRYVATRHGGGPERQEQAHATA